MLSFKKFKKPVAFLLALGLIFGSGISTVSASRADTGWICTTFGNKNDKGGIYYTGARVKETNTKAYVNFTTWDGHKGDFLGLGVVDKDFAAAYKWTVKATALGKYWVENVAYPNTREIRMEMESNYAYTYKWTAAGVWSPDSGVASVFN